MNIDHECVLFSFYKVQSLIKFNFKPKFISNFQQEVEEYEKK